MADSAQGTIVLKSISGETAKTKTIDFLVKISTNVSNEQVITLVNKAPVAIAHNVNREKAEKLIQCLQKLGAEASFVENPPKPAKTSAPNRSFVHMLLITVLAIACLFGLFMRQDNLSAVINGAVFSDDNKTSSGQSNADAH